VSSTERVLGVVKSVMLMQERFDALDERMKRLDGDLTNLGRSHSDLAQRVARIEGVMEGYARASSATRRLPKT
jgi:SMC interacting uncharacterized protein involved in chromosome segregation